MAEIDPLYERTLRESRAAYRAQEAYRRLLMVQAVDLSHPSIHLTQVVDSENRWGVACVWPQPHVASGDGSGPRELVGAGDDPAPDSPGVGVDPAGPDAGGPAPGPGALKSSPRAHEVMYEAFGSPLAAHDDELAEAEYDMRDPRWAPASEVIRFRVPNRQGQFVDPETLPPWVSGVMRGKSFTHAWFDEAATWKDGVAQLRAPRIEDFMDEVIREVMGCGEV